MKTFLLLCVLLISSVKLQAQTEYTLTFVYNFGPLTKVLPLSVKEVLNSNQMVTVKGYLFDKGMDIDITFSKSGEGWQITKATAGLVDERTKLIAMILTSIEGERIEVVELYKLENNIFHPNVRKCDCLSNKFLDYFNKPQ